jgi:polyisoprenoid-binding protein YceI
MTIISLLVGLGFSTSCVAQETTPDKDKLIVFIQKSKESAYTIKHIYELDSFAKEIGIPIKIVDVETAGAPDEVKYTPFIIYQNYLGRKIYKGRYTTLNRLKNFISTVQFMPSDAGEYTVSNALVYEDGRSEFFVQSKITPLKGKIPEGFNPVIFMKEAWEGIRRGMDDFKFYHHKNFLLANEIFYLNYYPYAGTDGRLYVSFELYSHYDCVTPIYKQIEMPIKGSLNSTRRVFMQAAKALKTEMMRQWEESDLGDAVSAIPNEVPAPSWEDLGFFIPPPPPESERKVIGENAFRFTQRWDFTSSSSTDKPALQFYFPPPIHQYSGFVKDITGGLLFEHKDSFLVSKIKGNFEVRTPSLTMGLEDLDEQVHKKMLFVKDHPIASFRILKVRAKKGAVVKIGQPTYTQVEAELTLMKKKVKVKAPAQFEPFIDDNGNVFLHVMASFKIENLMENYEIEGPPGPAEASNNIIIKIDMLLEPTGA